jgi:outer membrane protein assembly factor BamB
VNPRKPLRLWPGVVIVIVQWLLAFGVPFVAPDAEIFGLPIGLLAVMGGVLGALALVLWWLLFSRAPWLERVGAIVLMILAVVATRQVVHESIAGAGMGMLLYISAIPYLCLALVAWALVTRNFSTGARRAALVGTIVLACAPWALLRTAGVGGAGSEFHWRWTPTPEQRLLAQASDEPEPVAPPVQPAEAPPETPPARSAPRPAAEPPATAKPAPSARAVTTTPAEWPGFRGPERNSIIRGVRINTDWSAAPPVEMWRRPIGPGWSSFAVRGDFFYTQEQRGNDETVACYRVSNGKPIWRHRNAVRFWESNAGPGPRATPTLENDRVYAFGATGILNALDARSGKVVWSRNVATDTGRQVPDWGFASSPLVVDDVVIVAASGTLAAYDLATGNRRWVADRQLGSYSSPHRATIEGVPQVLLLSGSGVVSVAPASGRLLWQHEWKEGGATIVQPALLAGGDILVNAIAMTGGVGLRRLAVSQKSGEWHAQERWTSNGLKPYFNDFVVHKGHAFGFDGSILACIDLADGKRKWKGGRYGNGQLVLLPDQDLLLVVSEEGELALVGATSNRFHEIARVPALDGKTWNHPVVVRGVLLIRNGQEMAAFKLPVTDDIASAADPTTSPPASSR